LVISTPVAVVAAIGSAARSGVLIKGGAHLETLGQVTLVAFDKTGTLTTGQPHVVRVVPCGSHSESDVISVAAGIEYRSEHPVAGAILDKASELGLEQRHSTFFEAYPGMGARAVVGGELFCAGSRHMMEEAGIALIDGEAVQEAATQGQTVVWVADEKTCIGMIVVADRLRESAVDMLYRLKQVGIGRTALLTGDNRAVGQAVADELGVDEAFTELLPEAKLAKIKELRLEGWRVAMVGDGINDAPALAAADVGIAMGGAGNESAIEASDVTLMADDLTQLPYAIELSRRAGTIMKQNVWFALGVVVVLVVGAMADVVRLATGVMGHEGSALLVIANSLRLFKRPGSSTS
jgi:Cd2+/Zn2+-exporting ATPase